MNKKDFAEIKPQLTSVEHGREPSLRAIIYNYYESQGGWKLGKEFTDNYINEWLKLYNERNEQ